MSTDVTDNAKAEQYEIHVDGELAGLAAYVKRDRDGLIDFIHTEVEPRFQGQGLAGKLIKAALDEARAANLSVRPNCPYVRQYIARHPEYTDLVRPEDRPRYGL